MIHRLLMFALTLGLAHNPSDLMSVAACQTASSELRAPSGALLAKRYTRSDCKIELRLPGGELRGVYDPTTNETRLPSGKLVGKGDLLAKLLD